MSLIAKLLPPSNVLPDLAASSKKRLFEQVGLLFENRHGVAKAVVYDSLFDRERLGSTGLGQGVAIPHGRIKGLKEALADTPVVLIHGPRQCGKTTLACEVVLQR